MLGHRIRKAARDDFMAMHRRDVDHVSVAGRQHRRQRCTDAMPYATHIDVETMLPVGRLQGQRVSKDIDTRTVDQNIDASQCINRLREATVDALCIGHISVQRDAASASVSMQLATELVDRFGIPVQQRKIRAFLRE